MCFNDNDQKLWEEDPHEYVRKGYGTFSKKSTSRLQEVHFTKRVHFSTDIIEDLYSPRTAAMDFVSELIRKRGKENLQKFILFIVEIFKR